MGATGRIGLRTGGIVGHAVKQTLLAMIALVTCYPIYYIFVNSIKSRAEYANNPLSIPLHPVFHSYVQVWQTPNFLRWFYNSVFLTAVTVSLCVLISALASYAL